MIVRIAKTSMAIAALMIATVTSARAQGRTEGIAVAGHWRFEVHNADGSLHSTREFDNEFVGTFILMKLLTRQAVIGNWEIVLSAPTEMFSTASLDLSRNARIVPVDAVDPFEDFRRDHVERNLAVTEFDGSVPQTSAHDYAIRLSGNAVAATAGAVTYVSTGLGLCAPTAPGPCRDVMYGNEFTGTAIAPQPLDAGQILQVTVTIRFTTAPHPSAAQ